MTINIKGSGLDLTPAIKQFVEEKIGGLAKFLEKFNPDGLIVNVIIARTTNHHRHGDVYQIELNVDLPGKHLAAKAEGDDVRTAIGDARDKLKSEILSHKDKLDSHRQ